MAASRIDMHTIFKLVIWSFLVGVLLYWLNWSPGEVWGWIANKIAMVWAWLAGFGLKYVLLGATIVVPIFLLMHFRDRMRG